MDEAIRLIISRTAEGGFQIESAQRVEMRVPEMAEERFLGAPIGRFLEMRSGVNDLIQSYAVDDFIDDHVEFPTGNADEPFGRVEAPPGTVYSIVLPDHREVERLQLVELAPQAAPFLGAAESASQRRPIERRELATFNLN